LKELARDKHSSLFCSTFSIKAPFYNIATSAAALYNTNTNAWEIVTSDTNGNLYGGCTLNLSPGKKQSIFLQHFWS
jgi:hypothetical protein